MVAPIAVRELRAVSLEARVIVAGTLDISGHRFTTRASLTELLFSQQPTVIADSKRAGRPLPSLLQGVRRESGSGRSFIVSVLFYDGQCQW